LLAANETPLSVVPHVDLTRYAGQWYEIARLPNHIEKECAANVIAHYTVESDEEMRITSTCRKPSGETKETKGTARVNDKNGPNSKLKVTMFWPFSDHYWILKVDPEYKWTMIGSPNHNYLWVLSRQPVMDQNIYRQLLSQAKEMGFDTTQMILTKQGAPAS
jgi:apolipoprotein D and lipocalin family protein